MHTVTISLQGAANDSASIELGDAEALPVYVKLKEVVAGTRAARRSSRREAGAAADGSAADAGKNGNADLPADLDH